MAGNKNLLAARAQKNDEFYTLYDDIAAELKHYVRHFRGKRIICPCDWHEEDDAILLYKRVSGGIRELDIEANRMRFLERRQFTCNGFVQYFIQHGAEFGVRSVSISGYDVFTGKGKKFEDVDWSEFDLVVTNPPFSRFDSFLSEVMKRGKEFIVIGNDSARVNKELFCNMRDGRVWCGATKPKQFLRPDGGVSNFGNIGWYTNVERNLPRKKLSLEAKFRDRHYLRYDNYDAIEVGRVKDIPCDWNGIMGVPISFFETDYEGLFEIVGVTGGVGWEGINAVHMTKRYVNAVQHGVDGTQRTGGKVNCGAVIRTMRIPQSTYYTADNVDGYLQVKYKRILICRNRK